jgi:VIT1/CCC1 family predicted Fe2+/Mn2+ transporter
VVRGVTMTSMTASMFMLLIVLLMRGVLVMVHFFRPMFRMLSVIHSRH